LRTKFADALQYAGVIWRENVARPGERPGRDGLYHTFNEWHLGDNLIHLNFLRRLAVEHPDCEFIHACRGHYIKELESIVWPLKNIKIAPLKGRNPHAVDAWINQGAFSPRGGFVAKSPLRLNWVEFYKGFFADLARRMGLETPIHSDEDLLFNYPALMNDTQLPGRWDVLVCNSSMMSSQVRGWKDADWDDIIQRLIQKGQRVVCTKPSRTGTTCTAEHGLSVTGIGNVSMRVDKIIGCPSGPMWPTYNVWTKNKSRVVLQGTETVALGTDTTHARNKGDLVMILERLGWIGR
jgi:hypothetical protein